MRFGLVPVAAARLRVSVARTGGRVFWKLLLQVLKLAVVLGAMVAVAFHAWTQLTETILAPDGPVLRAFEVHAVFAKHNFTYSFNVSSDVAGICKDVRVLIFVTSRPDGFKDRQAIRDTWMYDKVSGVEALYCVCFQLNPEDMLVRFLIGQTEDNVTAANLEIESADHNDIVRFEYPDEYDLLTIKTHAALYWKRRFCPEADYLLKADDDTLVDMDRMRHFIETDYEERRWRSEDDVRRAFLVCQVFTGHRPFRDPRSKYFVSRKIYPNRTYPPFCQGCSYLLTSEAVGALLNHTHRVQYLKLEDVLFTGMVAEEAGVLRLNSRGFGNGRLQSRVDCDKYRVPMTFTQFGVRSDSMSRAYRRMKGQKCVKKPHHEHVKHKGRE